VVNFSSLFRDHTSYWQNRVQFVPQILDAIGRAAGIELFDGPARTALRDAAAAHRSKVRWLSITKWSAVLSILLLPVLFWQTLRAPGSMVDSTLRTIGGPFEKALNGLHILLAWLKPALSPDQVADLRLRLLGMLLVAFLILIWRLGYRSIFRWWDEHALDPVISPSQSVHPVDRVLVDGVAIVTGLAPLLVVAAWPYLRGLLVGHVIAGATLGFYALFFVAVVVVVVRKAIVSWPAIRRGDKAARTEVAAQLLTVGVLASAITLFLPAFVPELAPLHDLTVTGFIFVMYSGMIVALHQKVVARIDELTHRRAIRALAIAVPLLLTVLLLVRVAVEVARSPQVTEWAGAGQDAVLMLFTTYLASLGVIYLVLVLARRLRRRRLTAASS
jgi:hypothetical protein